MGHREQLTVAAGVSVPAHVPDTADKRHQQCPDPGQDRRRRPGGNLGRALGPGVDLLGDGLDATGVGAFALRTEEEDPGAHQDEGADKEEPLQWTCSLDSKAPPRPPVGLHPLEVSFVEHFVGHESSVLRQTVYKLCLK